MFFECIFLQHLFLLIYMNTENFLISNLEISVKKVLELPLSFVRITKEYVI